MLYYLKRIGQGVVTFIAASTVAFTMFRMLPGSPVQVIARRRMRQCMQGGGGSCDFEEIQAQVARRMNIDPNQPIPAAYAEYMRDVLLYQDFGISFIYNREVFELLFAVMPWSVFISLFGLALGFTFNIFWGAALAYKEGTQFDRGGTLFALAGNAIPYYVAAILALAYLGFTLHLFPTSGRYPSEMALSLPVVGTVWSATNIAPGFNLPFMLGVIWHGSLPIFAGFVLGINGLGMRGNSIRVMESDYIRVARLRGLSQTRIAQRYVARNAVLPLYTFLMIGLAGIFSSNIIMEKIFTYPAVGWYTYQALVNRDYPLLMGTFLFYTALTIIGILIADFTYQFIDPRAGGGGERETY